MICKNIILAFSVSTIFCFSCKSDYDKEVETSKSISNNLKIEKLPSYDSLHNKIILKRAEYPSQVLLADSLFRTTKEITNTIDSLIFIVEKFDSTGESREIGLSLLVNSPVGLRLTKGANSIYQYCLKSITDESKIKILEKQFSKYNGYLGSLEFNQVYFSKSSSSFIVMTLRGLKNDLIKATYLSLNDTQEFTTK